MTMTKEDVQALIEELVADKLKENEERQREVAAEAEDKFAAAIDRLSNAWGPKTIPKDEPKGLRAGRFIRAIAAGRGDPERAAKWARKEWGDEEFCKVLEASDAAAGGVLVPTEWSSEIIELLRNRAVVRSMGPRIVPMPSGALQIPKITGGATASYVGESQNVDVDEATFGQINLSWKKLAVLTPISNDLLRFSSPDADAIVRDDLVTAMALREDTAFLRDDGTQFTPKGLRYYGTATNVTATFDLDKVTADCANVILRMQQNNVRFMNCGWIMAPRTAMYLRTVRDTNNNFVWKAEMDAGTFFGYRYAVSNQVPITLGGSSDESEVYFADFADVIIGDSGRLEIAASDTAAYYDGSNVQAAFSRDQTVIRAIAHHDLGVRHDESIEVLTAVDWEI